MLDCRGVEGSEDGGRLQWELKPLPLHFVFSGSQTVLVHCGVLSPIPGWPQLRRLLFRLLFFRNPPPIVTCFPPPATFPPHPLTSFLFLFYSSHDTRHVLFPPSSFLPYPPFLRPSDSAPLVLPRQQAAPRAFVHPSRLTAKRARTLKGIQVAIHHCNSL